ncbi:3-dehydroquinate synthase [Dactylosporangium cerinum]
MLPTTHPSEQSAGLFALGAPVTHWAVKATQSVSYEIQLCDDVFALDNLTLLEDVTPAGGRPRRLLVVDANVDRLYGARIRAYLEHHDVIHRICVIDSGETAKAMDTTLRIIDALDDFGIDRRREPVIGVGGGVLLDMVGFACGMYRRATPYVRVPTTLIGLVDAAVGIKTGINNNGHKNRLGSYFAADRTLLDRTFLGTLPHRHVSNGLAEVLKIALIKDGRLFELFAQHAGQFVTTRMQHPADAATELLERAIQGMLEELQPNLWEKVLERVVDYGHTFSPTLEMHALPELLHGEAVSVDMALTTVLAERRGLLDAGQRREILAVMAALRLPTWHPLCTPDTLGRALRDTVRHRDGQQRLPLPIGIGSATFVNDVTDAELAEAARALAEARFEVTR